MRNLTAVDVSRLPDHDISSQAPLWWGQLLLAAIEGSMFVMLIATYFYLRLGVDIWPPPGTQFPQLSWATFALIPLLASCFGSYWASEGAKSGDRIQMLVGLVLNLLLALAAMALRAVEWHNLNFGWATDVHGSIVWSILFLHTFDTLADLAFTLVLIAILATGRHDSKTRIGVHVDSVVWYFIVAIWAPLYVVIYWGPRIVGAPR